MKKRILALVLAVIMTVSLLPVTAAAAAAPTPNIGWYGDGSATTFTLTDTADLLGLAKLVNDGTTTFAGKTVKLGANIDLGGIDWTPIGSNEPVKTTLPGNVYQVEKSFCGEFDGRGYIISNFHLDASAANARVGFFTYLDKPTANQPNHQQVHDLTLKNVTASVGAGSRVGALAYIIKSEYYNTVPKVENVHVENYTVTVTGSNRNEHIGGISAWLDTGAYCENCSVSNMRVVADNAGYIGGLSAFINTEYYSDSTKTHKNYKNCNINGLTITLGAAQDCCIGGFVAQTQINSKSFTFTDCKITGLDITVAGSSAQIGGFICSPGGYTTTTNCSVAGKIDVTELSDGYVGGFYGNLGWGAAYTQQINSCITNVNILTKDVTAGGFIGDTSDSGNKNANYDSCQSNGNVSVVEDGNASVGSFAGTADRGTFDNCVASGYVTGAGGDGLIGKQPESSTAEIKDTSSFVGAIVTPPDGQKITVEDGNVMLPEGTKLTTANGAETVLTNGGEIMAGGYLIDFANQAANALAWLTPILGALNTASFDDVAIGDWFYDDVSYVNERGLMTGTSAKQFNPNAPVTRGMVMTILARREGIKTDRYSPWYAAGCEWAKSVGISDGTNPDSPITREQLAVMLYRYAQYKGYDTSLLGELSFADASAVSNYAVSGLRWAVGAGLMSGTANNGLGKLLPQHTATRAQLAAILHRFFG